MRGDTTRKGSMAIKLDVAKAFDRVEWTFLSKIMLKTGFGTEGVNPVMRCVKSASFSLLINDHPSEHIVPSRGIR